MNIFTELSVSSLSRANLAPNGFTASTPIQVMAIQQALAGCDLVTIVQTGTSKTLAFVLPVIQAVAERGIPAERVGQ